jgi:hypothetical protein
MSSLTETSLQEIYGDTYQEDFLSHNKKYLADLLVSNIAARNFREVKHDFSKLFGTGRELPEQWFQQVKVNIEKMNPMLNIVRVTDLSALPTMVPNEQQISYFALFDMHNKKVYYLYVTPYILDAM